MFVKKNPDEKKKRNSEHLTLNQCKMRAIFMSFSDTPSGMQLAKRWEGQTPAFSGWMCLTTLVMMGILQSKFILIMLITKSLKLVIVCAEFEIIILLTPGSILYLPNTSFSITWSSTVVGTKGTEQIFVFPNHLEP